VESRSLAKSPRFELARRSAESSLQSERRGAVVIPNFRRERERIQPPLVLGNPVVLRGTPCISSDGLYR